MKKILVVAALVLLGSTSVYAAPSSDFLKSHPGYAAALNNLSSLVLPNNGGNGGFGCQLSDTHTVIFHGKTYLECNCHI